MSVFVTLLAFDDPTLINNSKVAIIIASVIAGAIGFTLLKISLKEPIEKD
jgi:NhaA family Na+:H+ antiporter